MNQGVSKEIRVAASFSPYSILFRFYGVNINMFLKILTRISLTDDEIILKSFCLCVVIM
jgi:hypothetical protein